MKIFFLPHLSPSIQFPIPLQVDYSYQFLVNLARDSLYGYTLHNQHMLCLVASSFPTLCDPMDCSLPGSSVQEDSPGKNTAVGCHALLQGIFPTQGSSLGLPYCRRVLYQLSPQGSPYDY